MPQNKSILFIGGDNAYKQLFFWLGIVIFIAMAVLGWLKLPYGFNFIDEGMYMVDGWRLTAGDKLFPDSSISVVMLYSIFNALIFKLNPDITLYGFRQTEYFLCMAALLLFSYSIYKWNRQVWYMPFVLSVFAFTGLDPVGMTVNLNYYTYPHLFMILYTSFMILALGSENEVQKKLLFILSGCMLWAAGFSLLPLSLGIVSPFLLWAVFRYIHTASIRFTAGDLLLVVAPVVVFWGIFIGIFNKDFFHAMADIFFYIQEGASSGYSLNILAILYILVVLGFLLTCLYAFKLDNNWGLVFACMLSVSMFSVIDTNLFGYIPAYWRGWFPAQMWFSAVLIIYFGLFALSIITRIINKESMSNDEVLTVIVTVPAIILTVLFSYISSMGVLSTLHVSVIGVVGLALFVVNWLHKLELQSRFVMPLAIVFILMPFYYNLAMGDWKFTYFDMPPKNLTYEFDEGFASGIKTNELFYTLAGWIKNNTDKYSDENDYMIVEKQTPMVYMITKRRPALNHSWTGWSKSLALQVDSIDVMIREKREPKIAFRFVRSPLFYPLSIKDGTFVFSARNKYDADDPITEYINTNMRVKSVMKVGGTPLVKFYVRKKSM